MKTINGSIRSFAKGSLAIFTICVLSIFSSFILESCSVEDYNNNFENVNNDEMIFAKMNSTLNSVSSMDVFIFSDNEDISFAKSGDLNSAVETLYISNSNSDLGLGNVDLGSEQIFNLEDLVNVTSTYSLSLSEIEPSENEVIGLVQIDMAPINAAINIATTSAVEYFYNKGFSDLDIVEMLDGEDRSTLVPIVMEMAYKENGQVNSAKIPSIFSIFGQSAYASSTSIAYGGIRACFLETTGIAAGVALVAALSAEVIERGLVKKLIKTAVKKIGGRLLGGIGLAIMVIDFSLCMGGAYD